jgi:hypothetical protein
MQPQGIYVLLPRVVETSVEQSTDAEKAINIFIAQQVNNTPIPFENEQNKLKMTRLLHDMRVYTAKCSLLKAIEDIMLNR